MSNRKSITFYLAIATTLYAVKSMAEEKTVSVQMPSRHSAVLKKYCFKCQRHHFRVFSMQMLKIQRGA